MRKIYVIAIFGLFCTSFFAIVPPIDAATRHHCTITGTAGNDVLTGTAGNDIICGLGGNDILNGLDGNDIIIGGTGNDRLSGGAGKDILLGNDGQDTMMGADGNDTLAGGVGVDSLQPGSGRNQCLADRADRMVGTCSRDVVKPRITPPRSAESTFNAGDRLVLTVDIGDESGIETATARVLPPSGVPMDWCPKAMTLISGDMYNGTYALECDTARNAVGGRYLLRVDAQDSLGNTIRNIDIPFTVIGYDRIDDGAGPRFTWDSSTERVFRAGTIADVRWEVEEPSGFSTIYAKIGGPNGWTSWCDGLTAEQIDGDRFGGTFGYRCLIPATAPNTTYSLFVWGTDVFGNATYLGTQIIPFGVTGGSEDTQGPLFDNVRLVHSEDPRTIRVQWHLTDATGVEGSGAYIAAGNGSFVDVLGNPFASFGFATRITGTAQDGIYEQVVTVRDTAPAGRYVVWLGNRDLLDNGGWTPTEVTFIVQ